MRSGKLVAILHDMYYVCYTFEVKVYDPILVCTWQPVDFEYLLT
jgi:hypothetical protein